MCEQPPYLPAPAALLRRSSEPRSIPAHVSIRLAPHFPRQSTIGAIPNARESTSHFAQRYMHVPVPWEVCLRIRLYSSLAAALLLATTPFVRATVFSTVHGVVHDPEHRPIAGADVTLKDADSDFALHATTGADGVFELPRVPIGVYRISITASGFTTASQPVAVTSGTNPVMHIPLAVASTTQSIVVESSAAPVDTATTSTLVTRAMIDQTPGAGRTLGMQMITDYVPGAYMVHDQLHIRGGHQTSWLIDGISIPNTKIGSNVGPQIDPKDIDSLETQRGSYGSELGDRTYAVFTCCRAMGLSATTKGNCAYQRATSMQPSRSYPSATTPKR